MARRRPSTKRGFAAPLTSFVGRDRELAALEAGLRSGARLFTLLGPPGAGKTRLALELGRRASSDFEAAAFCDLTPTRSLLDVCAAVAGPIGAAPSGASSPDEALAGLGHALAAAGRTLVVLDNAEHVLGPVGTAVAAWARAAPDTVFLVTSRELLRIEGETVLEIGPLGLPPPGGAGGDAVQLFAERWRAVRPGALGEADLAIVADLARSVDGLPLAIELVASRGVAFTLADLRAQLERRLPVAKPAQRASGIERQRTLDAAIAWSWRLLSEPERSALLSCAVFRGGFSPEAAADVAPTGGVDAVVSLREKSLLRSVDDGAGKTRYDLYAPVREFTLTELAAAPADARAARARHRAHFLSAAEAWAAALEGPGGTAALEALVRDRANVLAARAGALADSPGAAGLEQALRLSLTLDFALLLRGEIDAHLSLFDELLAHPARAELPEPLVARAEAAVGAALRQAGRIAEARPRLDWALAASERAGDAATATRCLRQMAWAHCSEGRSAEARAAVDAAIARGRAADSPLLEAAGLVARAAIGAMSGDVDAAAEDAERGTSLHLAAGSDWLRATAWFVLGQVRQRQGAIAAAEQAYARALEGARAAGDRPNEALAWSNVAILRQEHGQLDAAEADLEGALDVARRLGNRRIEAYLAVSYAGLLLEKGDLPRAEEAFDAALVVLGDLGERRSTAVALGGRAVVLAARDRLDEARRAFDRAARAAAAASDAVFVELLDLQRGHLAVAEARAAVRAGDADSARRHRRDALAAAGLDAPAPAPRSGRAPIDELRLHARVLRRAIARAALVVDPSGASFRPPGGEPVDLSRRPILGRMLLALVSRHTAGADDGLPVDGLFAAAWPGEKAAPAAAANRVRVAVNQLRTLGAPALEFRRGGYAFEPSLWALLVDGERLA